MEQAGTRTFRRVAVLALAGLAAALGFAAQAQQRSAPPGAAVPRPGTFHVLPMRPQARMLDDGKTCELIAGILTAEGELIQGGVFLYRDRSRRSFTEMSTREDGLVVAHFKAKPNEVVSGRPFWWDVRDQSTRYGPRVSTQCRSGVVSLGEPDRIPPR